MRRIIASLLLTVMVSALSFSGLVSAAGSTLWKWADGKNTTFDLGQAPTRYNYRLGKCKMDCSADFFTYVKARGVFQLGVQFARSAGTERRVIVEKSNGDVLIDEDWTERKNNYNPLFLSRWVGTDKTNIRIHVIDKYDDVWSEMDEAYRIVTRFRETDTAEVEPNNSQEMATPITLNKEMEGYYSPSDNGVDYYKFTADYSGWVTAHLSAIVTAYHKTAYYSIEAIGNDSEGGAGWAGGTIDGDKEDYNIGFTVQKGKTYYLKITCRENNIIPMAAYKLALSPNGGDMKDATVYAEKVKVFSGAELKPSFAVNFKGMKLNWGTQYTAWYENNTQIGQGRIKVVGKNGFSGSILKTFEIVPKTPYLAMNTTSGKINTWWNKSYGGVSGYQIAYAPNADMTGEKRVTVKANKLSAGFSLIKGKTYWFKVRAFKNVNGRFYYSAWSQPRGIKEAY